MNIEFSSNSRSFLVSKEKIYRKNIEYGIIWEGSKILTNQKGENSAFSILIGQNLRLSPVNTVLLYSVRMKMYSTCVRWVGKARYGSNCHKSNETCNVIFIIWTV